MHGATKVQNMAETFALFDAWGLLCLMHGATKVQNKRNKLILKFVRGP
jgi:hypothetical protein